MNNRRGVIRRGAIIGVLMTGLLAATCSAATFRLASSVEIPAAQGKAKLRLTSNGNTEVRLNVKHLAPPARIAPAASVFVVWVRGLEPGALAQNMGALRVNKNLDGQLKGVTSLRAFDLFMTCEGTQTIIAPTGVELLPLHYTGK